MFQNVMGSLATSARFVVDCFMDGIILITCSVALLLVPQTPAVAGCRTSVLCPTGCPDSDQDADSSRAEPAARVLAAA